jgi:hypothetical protein
MKLRSRMTGTALALTLSAFGLAACGSDGGGDDTKATTSQTDDSATDGAESAEPEAAEDGEDGKPEKQEVVDGYTKLVGDLLGGSETSSDIVDKVVTCFVDEVYDDASAHTLNAIAAGDQAGVDPNDAALFTEASTTCQKAAIG